MPSVFGARAPDKLMGNRCARGLSRLGFYFVLAERIIQCFMTLLAIYDSSRKIQSLPFKQGFLYESPRGTADFPVI